MLNDKFDNNSFIIADDLNLALCKLDYKGSRQIHSNVYSSKMMNALRLLTVCFILVGSAMFVIVWCNI